MSGHHQKMHDWAKHWVHEHHGTWEDGAHCHGHAGHSIDWHGATITSYGHHDHGEIFPSDLWTATIHHHGHCWEMSAKHEKMHAWAKHWVHEHHGTWEDGAHCHGHKGHSFHWHGATITSFVTTTTVRSSQLSLMR